MFAALVLPLDRLIVTRQIQLDVSETRIACFDYAERTNGAGRQLDGSENVRSVVTILPEESSKITETCKNFSTLAETLPNRPATWTYPGADKLITTSVTIN